MSKTRRTLGSTTVLAVLLAAAGCSKDAEVNAVIADLDSFTSELVKKVDGAGDPSAGVEAAQRFLEERKGDIREKFGTIKAVRGFQISEETKKKLTECAARNATAVATLRLKHAMRSVQDPAFGKRLEKLTNDYRDLLTI